MTKLNIKVTHEDIFNGRAESEYSHPICLAINRELKLNYINFWHRYLISLFLTTLFVDDKNGELIYSVTLPAKMREFVDIFEIIKDKSLLDEVEFTINLPIDEL